ncbi:tudor domain-containing protein 1 [Neosynchiropus ocellatus]
MTSEPDSPPYHNALRVNRRHVLLASLQRAQSNKCSLTYLFIFFSKQLSGKMNLCGFCGHEGHFFCTRCKKMSYCSVMCQNEDWKAHRHLCQSFEAEGRGIHAFALSADSKLVNSTIISRTYVKDLTMTKAIKGDKFQAIVTEFYSPAQFFLLKKHPEVTEALQIISTGLQKSLSSVNPYVPTLGEICVVQFSGDMQWYRGQVLTLDDELKMVEILYIDFGNKENVPVDRIRPLSPDMTKFGPCATKCYVAGVVPLSSDWSDISSTAVRQLLQGQEVTAWVVETSVYGHGVDIMISSGQLLSSFLLKHDFATKPVEDQTKGDIKTLMAPSMDNNGLDDDCRTGLRSSVTPKVGTSLSVVVTYIHSPDDIIVQNIENAGFIQDLQLKLRDRCSLASKSNFRPSPGTVCCAQFSEDKLWYRAKVLYYSSEQHLCVFYIDFGNIEEVHHACLRPIGPDLLSLPVQALSFSLAGVQPVGGNWSEACLLAFRQRLSNRILKAKILDMRNGKPLVTLVDHASDPEANVAEMLISAGYASLGPVAPDAHLADQETTAEKVTEPLKWSTFELPPKGQTVVLLSSVVNHPGDFCCYMNSPADEQQRLQLRADVTRHCEQDTSPFMPKVGEPCCAMCPSDGSWCRAIVKELTEDNLKVKFVDYGYTLMIEKDHIRSITQQLLTLPFAAVHCYLTGVEPPGSEWSSDAILWFQNMLVGEQLLARVTTVNGEGYGVELECRGENVAAALISKQLAKATSHFEEAAGNFGVLQHGSSNESEPAKDLEELSSGISFSIDWKSTELPLNGVFHPHITAVINPNLFYLLGHNSVTQTELEEVMVELAQYCTNYLNHGAAPDYSALVSGAACCAQFSSDHQWYRAVVLEVGVNEVKVIYADYGNTETIPLSMILPIPQHLLHLPFQIVRCSLAVDNLVGVEWTEYVTERFENVMLRNVLATVRSFDGTSNILSLSLPAEMGSGDVIDFLLDSLQNQTPIHSPTVEQSEKKSISDQCQVQSAPQIPTQTQRKVTAVQPGTHDGCCCESLKTKIEHLEQMMIQKLSLLTELMGGNQLNPISTTKDLKTKEKVTSTDPLYKETHAAQSDETQEKAWWKKETKNPQKEMNAALNQETGRQMCSRYM